MFRRMAIVFGVLAFLVISADAFAQGSGSQTRGNRRGHARLRLLRRQHQRLREMHQETVRRGEETRKREGRRGRGRAGRGGGRGGGGGGRR